MRSSPPVCLRRLREALLRSSASRVDDLLLVHRLQEAIERGLRQQQPEEQPEQPIEARRADLLGAAALIAGRAADAGGDAAHLEAARVQPLEARARLGRQAAEHRHERDRRRRRPRRRAGGLAGGVDLRVDRRAEPRHRDEPGEVGQLARRDERQQHRRERRQRGRGGAAEQEQQVPPEEKRFLQVVRHPGALRCRRRWRRPSSAGSSASRPCGSRQSPARVDVARLSMMSRISHTRSTNAGSRCISFGGRVGGGTTISRRIVPGADENT